MKGCFREGCYRPAAYLVVIKDAMLAHIKDPGHAFCAECTATLRANDEVEIVHVELIARP